MLIQKARRLSGQWLLAPGVELALELSTWEDVLEFVPDSKLEEAYKAGFASWDGKGELTAFDIATAYRAQLVDEAEQRAKTIDLWQKDNPDKYWCELCSDTGLQSVWVWRLDKSRWAGGMRPCSCELTHPLCRREVPTCEPEWIRGADAAWARVADIVEHGAPHKGFSYADRADGEGVDLQARA